MTLAQFVSNFAQITYALIAIFAIRDYIVHRNEVRFNVALLFGATLITIVISRIGQVISVPVFVARFSSMSLIVYPYLLLRVLNVFHPLPRSVMRAGLISVLIAWISLWIFPNELPAPAIGFIVAYFVITQFYAAAIFVQGGRKKRGLTSRRFILAATGSGLLGLTIFLDGLLAFFPQERENIILFRQIVAALSAISYYIAFVPPTMLRRLWQYNQLYEYLNRQRQLTQTQRFEQSFEMLRDVAAQIVYAQEVQIFHVDDFSGELKTESGSYVLPIPPSGNGALRSALKQGIARSTSRQESYSKQEQALLEKFNATIIYYVPIVAVEGVTGILAVFVRGYPLFVDDDLNLLKLFVEQHALMLEYGHRITEKEKLIDQLEDYADILKDSHKQERERFFRVSQNLIAVWNNNRGFKMFNPAWKHILGYETHELMQKNIEELIYINDREVFFEELQKLSQGDDISSFEARMVSRDNSIRWFSWWVTALPELGTLYGSAHDITRVKEKEEEAIMLNKKLLFQRERLNQIISSVPGVVWEISDMRKEPRRVDFISDYIEKMLGYTAEESVGLVDFWDKVLHPEDNQAAREHGRNLFTTGQNGTDEFRWIAKDGRIIHCLAQISIIKDANGTPVGMTGVTVDITPIKEAEQVQSRLAAIVESSQDAIIGHTLDGEITSWNEGARRIYGYNADEIIGHSIEQLWHNPPANKLERIRNSLQSHSHYERPDTHHKRKDGSVFPVSFVTSPVYGGRGKVIGASTITHDVTLQKEIEAELRNYTERLKRSNKALEEFAYIASHDLQEPLRKVQAFGDRLATRYKHVLDETGQDYLRRMQDAARRMRSLINDLLSYSRLTSTNRTLEMVDLNEVVQDVISNVDTRLNEKGGRIVVKELAHLEADAGQMRQLFQNIISNSIKYSQVDIPPLIEIEGRYGTVIPGERLMYEITLKDNGIGFNSRYSERIFELFQRLHSHNEYEGTGIGLAICRKIVDQHGGTIRATGKPKEGATFTIVLPLKYKEMPIYD